MSPLVGALVILSLGLILLGGGVLISLVSYYRRRGRDLD